MLIDVYINLETGFCFTEPSGAKTIQQGDCSITTIEAEPTDEDITEIWAGNGIEIGEVFSCNTEVENLKRIA